jgi:soluble lytic murein transglycosylase-like protein
MSTGDIKPVQFQPRDGGPPVQGVVYEGRRYLLDPYGAQRFRGGAQQPGMPREPGAAANPAQLANVARSFGLDDKTTDLALSIFQQESASGRANTSQANYAGARGPMQVTQATFDGLKRDGLIPQDWQHENPAHTAAAGIALIKQLHQQYAGDPRKIAAVYYSGTKAIEADGTIKNLRDPKNPKAPSTLEYVRQVTSRLAGSPRGLGTREVTGTIAQG